MIQIVPSHRQPTSALTASDAGATASPPSWGKWYANRHYSLEIAQHPLRARMCGFGDKDRRPIAPATVAKMIVRTKDNNVIDVEQIDPTFFVVTVDLWSEDGNKEMNLVLHPSSADRHASSHTPKHRRRGNTGPSTRESPTVPSDSLPNTSYHGRTPADSSQQSSSVTPILTPSNSSYGPAYPFPQSQSASALPSSFTFAHSNPYGTPQHQPQVNTWGYGTQVPDRAPSQYNSAVLPSINSMSRNASSSSMSNSGIPMVDPWANSRDMPSAAPSYRPWGSQDSTLAPGMAVPFSLDPSQSLRASHPYPSAISADPRMNPYDAYGQPRYPQEPFAAPPVPASHYEASMAASVYGGATHTPQYPPQQPSSSASTQNSPPPPLPASDMPSLPRHTYTRTLVGPLSANACRLLDEHRKPGIFFLFQDLSVRTEGTFRLRLRLMHIGPPNIPGVPYQVQTGVSPILAQIFTEPFVVYSAKRFPGVPDTTALSIAFGNQGQKLPLRSKNGESKGRRRKRNDSDSGGSDDGYD